MFVPQSLVCGVAHSVPRTTVLFYLRNAYRLKRSEAPSDAKDALRGAQRPRAAESRWRFPNRRATRLTWCFLNVSPGRLICLCHVRMFPLPCSIPPAEADLAAHPQKAPAPVPSRFKRLFHAESCGTALTWGYASVSPGRDYFLCHTCWIIAFPVHTQLSCCI